MGLVRRTIVVLYPKPPACDPSRAACRRPMATVASILPVLQPLLMARVTVGLQVMPLPPQLLRPETQPHPARRNVSLQHRQFGLQIRQPAPFLVNPLPPTLFRGNSNLPFRPVEPTPEAILPQPLRACLRIFFQD